MRKTRKSDGKDQQKEQEAEPSYTYYNLWREESDHFHTFHLVQKRPLCVCVYVCCKSVCETVFAQVCY